MKLGLSLLFLLGKPLKKALSVVPRAVEEGVQVIELVDEAFHSLSGKKLSLVADALSCFDLSIAVHGPFVDVNIGSPYEPMRRFALRRHFRSMEAAAKIGASSWIFHPGLRTGVTYYYPGVEWHKTIQSIREIYRKADELGITALLENGTEPVPFVLKKVEDFERLLSELGGDVDLKLAFDVGHANLNGQIQDFIRAFPGLIEHVHVHDNDGKSDLHLGLGKGTVNWPEVIRALKESGYNGPLVVESVEDVWESLAFLRSLLA